MKSIVAALALIPFIGYGAIEPIIIGFADIDADYTVPAGKVLVIQSVGSSYLYIADFQLIFIDTVSTNVVTLTQATGIRVNPIPLNPTIKVPAGTNVKARNLSNSSSTTTVMGLLVDPSDLYVTMNSTTDNIMVADGRFSFDVLTASARPARISVIGSSDLETWSPADAVVEKKSTDTYAVSLLADQEQYFANHAAIIAVE